MSYIYDLIILKIQPRRSNESETCMSLYRRFQVRCFNKHYIKCDEDLEIWNRMNLEGRWLENQKSCQQAEQ